MEDQNPVAGEQEVVQLSPRETYIIQTHSTIRFAAASKLDKSTNADIQNARMELHRLMRDHGDAAKVALILFNLEFDNTEPPYGDTFVEMPQLSWEEALKMWAAGYIDPETV